MLAVVSSAQDWEWVRNFRFRNAAPIRMIDPLLHTFGVAGKEESAVRMITLADLVNLHGHLCPGVLSSYLIPSAVIAELYKGGEVPRVGDITMTTPSDEGLYGDVALVLRLEDNKKHGPQTWFIDKDAGKKDASVFLFQRVGDSSAVEISFDKKAFIATHTDPKSFRALKSKVLGGNASDKEIAEFRNTVVKMVDDLYSKRETMFAARRTHRAVR
jgi:hypothetical protein